MSDFNYSRRSESMKPSIIRELFKQMADPSIISFAGGNPAKEAFPVEQIRKISQQIMQNEAMDTLQYSLTEGVTTLRTACADFANMNYKVKKEEDETLVVTGSMQAIELATKLLCNEGDNIVVENPTFLGALNTFRSFAANLQGVPMQADGVDLDELEKLFSQSQKPRFFYTIPNFQNPTGITMSVEKRKAVAELAKRYKVPVLEDNPYGELRFDGEELPPIKAFDTDGWVIYTASLSKIVAPGLRVGFCIAPAEFVAKMAVAKQGEDVHTCVWAQKVAEGILRSPERTGILTDLQSLYKQRAGHMMNLLDEKLGGELEYITPKGGMFIWAILPKDVNMLEYVRTCLQSKLAIVPGNAFYVDENELCSGMRLNFASPAPSQIDAGIEIMQKAMRQMKA